MFEAQTQRGEPTEFSPLDATLRAPAAAAAVSSPIVAAVQTATNRCYLRLVLRVTKVNLRARPGWPMLVSCQLGL